MVIYKKIINYPCALSLDDPKTLLENDYCNVLCFFPTLLHDYLHVNKERTIKTFQEFYPDVDCSTAPVEIQQRIAEVNQQVHKINQLLFLARAQGSPQAFLEGVYEPYMRILELITSENPFVSIEGRRSMLKQNIHIAMMYYEKAAEAYSKDPSPRRFFLE